MKNLRPAILFPAIVALAVPASAHADPAVDASREGLVLRQPIVFDLRSVSLDANAGPILDAIALAMREPGAGAVLEVGVHTDARGSDAYNQRQSQAVAELIVSELVRRGIPARRLRAVGYGESRPLAAGSTRAGRDANRRVELRWL